MRLSASRIRSINRCLAYHGSIICSGSDTPVRRPVELPKPPAPTLKIVAVSPKHAA
jgi:hypothetical protein